jgi:hypothetical protein
MDDDPFRCLACGGLSAIDAPGALTLGVKDRPGEATAPKCVCGGRSWVRAGTTTEYYLYSRRPDVCRVGDHIDARARSYQLVPRTAPDVGGHAKLVSLEANVCPDHLEHVRVHGIFGCFLADEAAEQRG